MDVNLAPKETDVHRGYRYLSSLLLTAALAAPVAAMAAASPQDDRSHENREGENNKRYYDKGHKDYHNWDANEDRSYQRYQTEHHERRPFVQLNTRQQTVYWNWRHSNPDNRITDNEIAMRICDRLRGGWPRLRHPPAEEQDYDLHDDEALPDLQTAINQAETY